MSKKTLTAADDSAVDQTDESTPLQPVPEDQLDRSRTPGRFLLPSERQEVTARDRECDPDETSPPQPLPEDRLQRLVSRFVNDVECHRDLERADTIIMRHTGNVLETYRKAGIVALALGVKVMIDTHVPDTHENVSCGELVRFISDQNHPHEPPEFDQITGLGPSEFEMVTGIGSRS